MTTYIDRRQGTTKGGTNMTGRRKTWRFGCFAVAGVTAFLAWTTEAHAEEGVCATAVPATSTWALAALAFAVAVAGTVAAKHAKPAPLTLLFLGVTLLLVQDAPPATAAPGDTICCVTALYFDSFTVVDDSDNTQVDDWEFQFGWPEGAGAKNYAHSTDTGHTWPVAQKLIGASRQDYTEIATGDAEHKQTVVVIVDEIDGIGGDDTGTQRWVSDGIFNPTVSCNASIPFTMKVDEHPPALDPFELDLNLHWEVYPVTV